MTDVFSIEKRSSVMRSIKGKDTKPELVVRSIAHRLGYRFRLHRASMPGRPDLVFVGRRKVVFVHGCFWHGHATCRDGRMQKSNTEYWTQKISGNQRRDARSIKKLRSQGWSVMTVWECQTEKPESLANRLKRFLG